MNRTPNTTISQTGELTTRPEIRLVQDRLMEQPQVAYFYSIAQLELMRDNAIKNASLEELGRRFNRMKGNAIMDLMDKHSIESTRGSEHE